MPPGSGTKEEAIAFANAGGGNYDPITGKDRDRTTNKDGYNIASLAATAAKTAARIAADKAKDTVKVETKPKIKTTIDSVLDTPVVTTEKADEPFSFSNWWKDLFSPRTEEEKANEPDDQVKSALKFILSPVGSVLPKFLDEVRHGMNDDAKTEYLRLTNLSENKHPNSDWNLMTEAQRVELARKPQIDNQLPHAFVDGHPTTDIQKKIAELTGGKSPTHTVYNGDGSVNVQATAATIGSAGGTGGTGGTGVEDTAAVVEPKWWEVGQNATGVDPVVDTGGTGVTSGTYNPYDLRQEMSATPDFTGSYDPDQELMQGSQFYQPQQPYNPSIPLQAYNQTAQTSLLGNTALPSQQITGLLAPPRQEPQFNPNRFNNLLGGNS